MASHILSFSIGAALAGTFTNTIKTASEKVNVLRSSFGRLSDISMKFESFDKLKNKITTSQAALSNNRQELFRLKSVISQTDAPSKGLVSEFNNLKKSTFKLASELKRDRAEFAGLSQEMKDAKVNMADFENERKRIATKKLKLGGTVQKLNRLESGIGNMNSLQAELRPKIASSIIALGAITVPFKVAIDFEQAMRNVKSVINGASEADLNILTTEAKRLGATTSFSASQAADGMKYLAMTGFQTNQIVAAMPGLLDMAKAGVMDLGRASDISSNILSAFGLKAGEMNRVADVLTMTFTTSNTTLESLADSMKYVAPIARQVGMSLEDASAMAGLLGNVGIRGQMAGTQLRAMVNRLTGPIGAGAKTIEKLGLSTKDAAGNMRPITEILVDIGEKTKSMGSADRLKVFKDIFGEEAVSGLAELITQEGEGGISKYIEILKNSKGKAAAVAKEQGDTVQGAFIELGSAVEGVSIAFASLFLPAIKGVAQTLGAIARGLNLAIEKCPVLTMVIGSLVGGIMGLVATMRMLKFAYAITNLTILNMRKDLLLFGNTALGTAIKTTAVTTALWFKNTALKAVSFTATGAGKAYSFLIRVFSSTAIKSYAVTAGILAQSAALKAVGIKAKIFTGIQWLLNGAMAACPLTWLIAGVVAIAAGAYLLIKHWDKVKVWFSGFLENLISACSAGFTFFGNFLSTIYKIILYPFNMAGAAILSLFGVGGGVGGVFKELVSLISSVFTSGFVFLNKLSVLSGKVTSGIGYALEEYKKLFLGFMNIVFSGVRFAGNLLSTIYKIILYPFNMASAAILSLFGVGGGIVGVFQDFWSSVKAVFSSGFEFIDRIAALSESLTAGFLSVVDTVKGWFGGDEDNKIGIDISKKLNVSSMPNQQTTSDNNVIDKYYGSQGLVAKSNTVNNAPNMAYSQQITIQGNADKEQVAAALDEGRVAFERRYNEMKSHQARLSYAGGD